MWIDLRKVLRYPEGRPIIMIKSIARENGSGSTSTWLQDIWNLEEDISNWFASHFKYLTSPLVQLTTLIGRYANVD